MAVLVIVGIVFFGLLGVVRFSLSRVLERQGYRPSRLPPSLDPDHIPGPLTRPSPDAREQDAT
jgi:hypothetical protein